MTNFKEEVSEKRTRIINELVEEGLHLAEVRYGSGHGDGNNPLAYHNRVHTEDVVNAARKICKLAIERNKISAEEGELVVIAASFHDVEQSLGSGLNEKESGEIVGDHMRRKGIFTEEEVERVEQLIGATVTKVEVDRLIQSPTDDYLTKIICDADLVSFGMPFDVFWDRSLRIQREFEKKEDFSSDDYKRIASRQISLLKNHSFYTLEAGILFNQKKQNIVQLRQMVSN